VNRLEQTGRDPFDAIADEGRPGSRITGGANSGAGGRVRESLLARLAAALEASVEKR
jgi:hypothetical protein